MEDKNRQIAELQALVERYEPVFSLVARMSEAWAYRFKTLPDGIQEIIRTYNRAMKGEKEREGIHDSGSVCASGEKPYV